MTTIINALIAFLREFPPRVRAVIQWIALGLGILVFIAVGVLKVLGLKQIDFGHIHIVLTTSSGFLAFLLLFLGALSRAHLNTGPGVLAAIETVPIVGEVVKNVAAEAPKVAEQVEDAASAVGITPDDLAAMGKQALRDLAQEKGIELAISDTADAMRKKLGAAVLQG